jgi:hypothetical protein
LFCALTNQIANAFRDRIYRALHLEPNTSGTAWYNGGTRLHSTLGYRCPADYESSQPAGRGPRVKAGEATA